WLSAPGGMVRVAPSKLMVPPVCALTRVWSVFGVDGAPPHPAQRTAVRSVNERMLGWHSGTGRRLSIEISSSRGDRVDWPSSWTGLRNCLDSVVLWSRRAGHGWRGDHPVAPEVALGGCAGSRATDAPGLRRAAPGGPAPAPP